MTDSKWVCRACHKGFVREKSYLIHQCKELKREAEFKSPIGQAAWQYYTLWLRAQKRHPPPANSFLASKYFRTFINFTTFTQRVDLPCPDKFIWLMVEKGFSPVIWMNDEVYVMYIEYLDRKATPIEQTKLSVDTLIRTADRYDVDVSNVFDVLTPQDILQMIRVRKLSPWLLLSSKKFKTFFNEKTTVEQKIILEAIIRPEYWAAKMSESTQDLGKIKLIVQELGI